MQPACLTSLFKKSQKILLNVNKCMQGNLVPRPQLAHECNVKGSGVTSLNPWAGGSIKAL